MGKFHHGGGKNLLKLKLQENSGEIESMGCIFNHLYNI